MLMEKYLAALQHATKYNGYRALHLECSLQCRSAIIAKCIELYPEALAGADKSRYLPLHIAFGNESLTFEDALLMMVQYPAAVQRQNKYGELPLHIECEIGVDRLS